MSAAASFHTLAGRVHHLLGCGSVHLLLGCSEPGLRHPLLELFPTNRYHYIGDSADIYAMLHDEHVRALCDMAIQTGQVQSSSQGHATIAVAPLERPAGLLGLFLLTDLQPEAFSQGEQQLLSGYLQTAAESLEQDLRNLYTTLLRSKLMSTRKSSPMTLQDAVLHLEHALNQPRGHITMTDEVIITDATDTKDEFISMVSHELRMPLTSIKGYAGLLQAYGVTDSSMTPARQRHYLATIMEQADHLGVLIGDLLDMSRIQAGRLALRFTSVDVAQLCQRAVELAQQRADQQQPERYTIRCLLDQQLPSAWADPDRVQQVLANLLENAIKYSPDGGTIEVLACARRTSPLVKDLQQDRAEPPMLHITIRDQGIGILPQQQALLFKPFSRLEHPATDQVVGTGLGLYMTRKLVEAMHGNVTLHSSEGEGTSVTFTLPMALAPSRQTSLADGASDFTCLSSC